MLRHIRRRPTRRDEPPLPERVPFLPPLSIRQAVLVAVVLAVMGPMLALWHVEQALTRRAYEPLVEQGRQSRLTLTAATLVEPLWSLDEAAVQRAARQALADPAVMGVQVDENRPGAPSTVVSREAAVAGPSVRLSTELHREGERLGTLTLSFDPGQIDRLLAERRLNSLALAAVQTLLGVAVLAALLYRRLVAPIRRLMNQASALATRGHGRRMAWRLDDELGQLGRHLNAVHDQIDGLFDRLQAQKAEIEQVALHDALTGLPNRALFGELAAKAVAQARRGGTQLAMLFVDLDRFKAVNDAFGHAGGDAVLRECAARLQAALRAGDVACRHSGDEFLVLLHPVRTADDVAATADRLLERLQQPMRLEGREAAVSASIGIALFPQDGADHEALVRNADTAMYAAKRQGRDCHSFFRPELEQELQASQRLERELERALEQGEFELHYQPQVHTSDGTPAGCEALIRWNHPERGLVPPLQFIPAAEQCGLIADIGAWTLRAACRQIAQWRLEGVPFHSVAVNVSALEFRGHRLPETLARAMAEFGVQPHELELEITESVLMSDTEGTRRIVGRLHEMGLPLAVDDFGTGHSSLAYLKQLRPAKLKIDRHFVRDIEDDADDRVIVQAIVGLAHALGIRVVAEGVETDGQRAHLHEMGCEVLQGYLVSRPQPAAAAARSLRALAAPEAAATPGAAVTEPA